MTDAELERVPVVMNLVVARGIPAFANLDIARHVSVVDGWAREIQHGIDRHAYRFARNPAEFDHSLAKTNHCPSASAAHMEELRSLSVRPDGNWE